MNSFQKAIRQNNVKLMQIALEKDPELIYVDDKFFRSSLMLAAFKGSIDAFKFLIKHLPEKAIFATNLKGRTALDYAFLVHKNEAVSTDVILNKRMIITFLQKKGLTSKLSAKAKTIDWYLDNKISHTSTSTQSMISRLRLPSHSVLPSLPLTKSIEKESQKQPVKQLKKFKSFLQNRSEGQIIEEFKKLTDSYHPLKIAFNFEPESMHVAAANTEEIGSVDQPALATSESGSDSCNTKLPPNIDQEFILLLLKILGVMKGYKNNIDVNYKFMTKEKLEESDLSLYVKFINEDWEKMKGLMQKIDSIKISLSELFAKNASIIKKDMRKTLRLASQMNDSAQQIYNEYKDETLLRQLLSASISDDSENAAPLPASIMQPENKIKSKKSSGKGKEIVRDDDETEASSATSALINYPGSMFNLSPDNDDVTLPCTLEELIPGL